MHQQSLFPVAGTMMIEPTESESKDELDRFCNAMLEIRKEIDSCNVDESNNILKNSPHTLEMVTADKWNFVILEVKLPTL